MNETKFANNVSVRVNEVGTGLYRACVVAPDRFTGQMIVSPVLGRKLPWKTEAAAMKAGVAYALNSFADIIDPVSYWA